MISLATFHSLQRTHVWTIILTMIVILSWVILRYFSPSMIILWVFNMNLIVLKHRNEIREGVIPRNWLINIVRKEND
jgi:regulatory protein YycH of two-component signal transduction system YycFG